MASLTLNEVSFDYGPSGNAPTDAHLPVLNKISFTVTTGELVAVVGPSGCGKSTLLNLIAGLLQPTSGTILFEGAALDSRIPVGYVFQSPSLIPWRTIRDNALFGAEIAGGITAETQRRCQDLLKRYGLRDFESSFPGSVSGGMQQRASIIRAVISSANVILLDEPFSNSDFLLRRELQTELSRLVDEEELIAILVTHDVEDAVRTGDRVIVLTQRPARVKTDIEIPITRTERLRGGASVIRELAGYVDRVEAEFDSPGKNLQSLEAT